MSVPPSRQQLAAGRLRMAAEWCSTRGWSTMAAELDNLASDVEDRVGQGQLEEPWAPTLRRDYEPVIAALLGDRDPALSYVDPRISLMDLAGQFTDQHSRCHVEAARLRAQIPGEVSPLIPVGARPKCWHPDCRIGFPLPHHFHMNADGDQWAEGPSIPDAVAGEATARGHAMDTDHPEDLGWCHRFRCTTCSAALVVPKAVGESGEGWGAATQEACPIEFDATRPTRMQH